MSVLESLRDIHREAMEALARGRTAEEVEQLRVATLGNARILGIEGITGSVAEGKSADILVLKRDPIADLSALSEIAFMFAQGRFIDAPKPKKMKKIDAVLDTLMSSVGE